jgi:hypothetical protein
MMVDEKTGEQTTPNNDTGDKPESADKIERAEQAVKRMEDAEKRLDEKISKLQELEVNRLLGSTAGGRVESPQLTEEQAKKQQAIEFWKGTTIADAILKTDG